MSKGKAWAFLDVYGVDNQHIYQALAKHRVEIDAELNGCTEWEQEEKQSWMGLQTEMVTGGPMLNLEAVGEWIAENLLRLRAVVQPYLDQVMDNSARSRDDAQNTE